MNNNPNTEGIKNYAIEKSEETYKKVEKCIKELIKEKQIINFNSISNKSGVSKSYLYNNSKIRERIIQLRKQQSGLKTTRYLKRQTSDDSKDVIIAVLKNKNEQLLSENRALKAQLQNYLRKEYEEI